VDSETKLQTALRRALDEVVPEAPWLAAGVRDHLRDNGRGGLPNVRAIAGWAGSLTVAVALVAVAVVVVSAVHPQPVLHRPTAVASSVPPSLNPWSHVGDYHIVGTVRDENGAPVFNAAVKASLDNQGLISGSSSSATAADGTYELRFRIPNPRFEQADLTVRHTDFEDRVVFINRIADGSITPVDVTLRPKLILRPGAVTLTVTAKDGYCYTSLDVGAPCRTVHFRPLDSGLYTLELAPFAGDNRLGLQVNGGALCICGPRVTFAVTQGDDIKVDVLFLNHGNISYLPAGAPAPQGTDSQEFTISFRRGS